MKNINGCSGTDFNMGTTLRAQGNSNKCRDQSDTVFLSLFEFKDTSKNKEYFPLDSTSKVACYCSEETNERFPESSEAVGSPTLSHTNIHLMPLNFIPEEKISTFRFANDVVHRIANSTQSGDWETASNLGRRALDDQVSSAASLMHGSGRILTGGFGGGSPSSVESKLASMLSPEVTAPRIVTSEIGTGAPAFGPLVDSFQFLPPDLAIRCDVTDAPDASFGCKIPTAALEKAGSQLLKELTIHLHSYMFGELRLRIEVSGRNLRVAIQAKYQVGLEKLAAKHNELVNFLSDRGVAVTEVVFLPSKSVFSVEPISTEKQEYLKQYSSNNKKAKIGFDPKCLNSDCISTNEMNFVGIYI